MSDKFIFVASSEPRDPAPRTSLYVRAIVRVRRVDVAGYGQFEVSVSPRTRDWRLADWICESRDEIAGQIPRAERLRIGQAASFDVVLRPWSTKYWTDCGYEHDAGIDVAKVRRTLRCSRKVPR